MLGRELISISVCPSLIRLYSRKLCLVFWASAIRRWRLLPRLSREQITASCARLCLSTLTLRGLRHRFMFTSRCREGHTSHKSLTCVHKTAMLRGRAQALSLFCEISLKKQWQADCSKGLDDGGRLLSEPCSFRRIFLDVRQTLNQHSLGILLRCFSYGSKLRNVSSRYTRAINQ